MTKRPTLDQKPSKAELEKQLDDALQQTFPASDPVTVGEPTAFIADRPAHRQTPLLDKELVDELAAHVEKRTSAATSKGTPHEQDHLKNRKGRGGQRDGVVG